MAREITHYESDFKMAPLVIERPSIHVGVMYLAPGGGVGYHQASTGQVFAVVDGSGWVRGEDEERKPIGKGDAAFWTKGEWHEAGTDAGMMAVVVESDLITGPPVLP